MKKLVIIVFLFGCFLAWGQNEALFNKATDAYNEGKYEAAIENYLKIIESGQHSAELYFNLGNSYDCGNSTVFPTRTLLSVFANVSRRCAHTSGSKHIQRNDIRSDEEF